MIITSTTPTTPPTPPTHITPTTHTTTPLTFLRVESQGFTEMFTQFIYVFLSEVVPLLLAIAVITLIERRAMGSMQRRRGPNEHGTLGMFQPIADGMKLVLKELFHTSNANAVIFMGAPILTLYLTILM
jgi:NADH:ubiquinone oxidoreductase subunit H